MKPPDCYIGQTFTGEIRVSSYHKRIDILRLTFKDEAGNELENIHRVGISAGDNDRKQRIQVEVSPPELTYDLILTVGPKFTSIQSSEGGRLDQL